MALTIKLRCKKHPRYNPLQGEQAIRGGCKDCHKLLQIYFQYLDFVRSSGPIEWNRIEEEEDYV